jgi:endoglucanase
MVLSMKKRLTWLFLGAAMATLGFAQTQQNNLTERTKYLARSINFGNALEAPNEGEWGIKLEESYFAAVQKAGFTAIRLPIKWSNHALTKAPYTINPTFLARVDWAVQNATSRGLAIVLNVHHYDEILENPSAHKDRLLALWQQIALHYQNQSDKVFFEILNEPNAKLEAVWNEYQNQVIATIRKSNPTRALIVGGNGWNSIAGLEKLQLPNDPNLIGTFHFYAPFNFTHQGAEWVSPSPAIGITWADTTAGWQTGWQNWSWNTTIQAKPNGFEITYNNGYAGLYLHNDNPIAGVSAVQFTSNQSQPLTIACLEKHAGGNINGFNINSTIGINTIPTKNCGSSNGTIRDIIIMNNSPSSKPVFNLSSLELQTSTGKINLFSSSANELYSELARAATWSKKTNRPVFMGEFGSYNKADLPSRIRWTTFVRSTAEELGIPWAYWEFAAGFGIYNPTSRQYRTELTKALLPNFKP